MLKAENLSKSYGNKQVVKNVSLNVQEGDFVKKGDILVEGTPVHHTLYHDILYHIKILNNRYVCKSKM